MRHLLFTACLFFACGDPAIEALGLPIDIRHIAFASSHSAGKAKSAALAASQLMCKLMLVTTSASSKPTAVVAKFVSALLRKAPGSCSASKSTEMKAPVAMLRKKSI